MEHNPTNNIVQILKITSVIGKNRVESWWELLRIHQNENEATCLNKEDDVFYYK